MAISASRSQFSLRWKASRDWPLTAAAVSAFLSFIMLFPPWLTSEGDSENAFGDSLQSAGPALIIVMALATVALLGVAVATTNRRYVWAALVSSLMLLAIYVIKVADVSDLADLYSRLAASFTGTTVGTGAGLWLGFVFSLFSVLFLLLALAFKWGIGEKLAYPNFSGPREPRSAPPQNTQEAGDAPHQEYPSPPPHEPPTIE
ncbi:hypothetical protein ACIO93_36260 [Streptomyces sp. NPDC087903]|uniref:hypothetical protein n=1 Tax=Streptomyces sp. NPDC087903 TaxID=3365819 RepID=UPI00382C0796